MENITLLAAFGAGLVSFLSPCVLPIVPVYLASLSGPGVFEDRRSRLPTFLHALSFVAGFSLVFVILGAGAGLAGFALSPYSPVVRQIAGGLLIALGVFMLAALKVPWLNYEKRLAPSTGRVTGYLRSLLIGGTFSLAWTPCLGPIIGTILIIAGVSETALHGAYLLAAYSLGLGLPFLAIGAALDSATPLLRRIHRYSGQIHIASGILLIAVGILILTNSLNWLLP